MIKLYKDTQSYPPHNHEIKCEACILCQQERDKAWAKLIIIEALIEEWKILG